VRTKKQTKYLNLVKLEDNNIYIREAEIKIKAEMQFRYLKNKSWFVAS
jgi:hypothetical protein